MIGSRGEAAIYPEINEAEHKPPGMYRVTFPPYDSMSEFEDDDAQEEEEEDIHVPPNPSNVPTPGYRRRTVMPLGLTNAPATFQRTMDMTFSDMIDYTDIYVDDIVVYSESLEDHLVHL